MNCYLFIYFMLLQKSQLNYELELQSKYDQIIINIGFYIVELNEIKHFFLKKKPLSLPIVVEWKKFFQYFLQMNICIPLVCNVLKRLLGDRCKCVNDISQWGVWMYPQIGVCNKDVFSCSNLQIIPFQALDCWDGCYYNLRDQDLGNESNKKI